MASRGHAKRPGPAHDKAPRTGIRAELLNLQRTMGNRAVSHLIDSGGRARPVQRAGPDEDAITPAPPGPPAVRDFMNSHEIPAYFESLDWQDSDSGGYKVAHLQSGDPVWEKVEEYARLSQARAPETAPTGEATRMNLAKERSADQSLTGEQRANNAYRATEGRKGGPRPPRSAEMEIVDIVVVANPELWKKYQASRQMFRQSLVSREPGGLDVTGRDRSERIPWTTRERPDLGGSARVSATGEFAAEQSVAGSSAGEAFLWHGATPEILGKIQQGGMKPEMGKNKGTEQKPRYGKLGQGSYFADNSSKAQLYTPCPVCHKDDCNDPGHAARQMMLARVLVGHPDFAHVAVEAGPVTIGDNRRAEDVKRIGSEEIGTDAIRDAQAKGRTGKDWKGFTSVMSPGLKHARARLGATGTNEFVIKDSALIYPELIVHYRPRSS